MNPREQFDHIVAEEFRKGTPIAQIANKLIEICGWGSDRSVRRSAKKQGILHSGIESNPRGKIVTEGSFTGEDTMEPTKAQLEQFKLHCEEHGLPFELWRSFWHKTGQYSSFFVNKEAQEAHEKEQEEFLQRIGKRAPKVKRQPLPTKSLAVIASFDVHIGKHCEVIRTGNDYTPDEAVRRVVEGQNSLIGLTKPFGVSDILLPMGNDIIHVDSNKAVTTGGTHQDTYGSVESQMLLATELYIRSINELSKNYNVWLCHVNSNHDREKGWAVSQMVSRYFEGANNKRVNCAKGSLNNQHRKYFVFGDSLIMFHHGDMRKEEKLLGIIKKEANEALAQTNRVYVYQGDTHHKTVSKRGILSELTEEDQTGLTVIKAGNGAVNQVHVETVRSPSPADEWHSRAGFLNFPAVEVFVHDNRRQFARFTHEF